MTRNLPKRLLMPICALTVLAGLSGCMKIDMDMKVKSNEKIDGSAILAFSDQLLALTGQSKAEFLKSMKDDQEDLPKGSKVENYDKDGFIGQKIIFKDLPVSEFGKATSAGAKTAGTATGSDSSGDDMTLVKEGGNWKFTGDMNLSDTLGVSGAKPKKGEPDPSAMMKGIKIKIKMTFPGKIIKTDKDAKVSGKTVTWEPKFGQNVQMLAIAKTS
jgi:hypothetical protein